MTALFPKKLTWTADAALGLFSLWAGAALAIDLPSPAARVGGTLAFLTAAGLLARRRRPSARLAWAVLDLAVLAWWLGLRPTNDRAWPADVAQPPWAEIAGDRTVIHGLRAFTYRTELDYVPRWETRTLDLSQVEGVDLFLTHWGVPFVAHTIVSFAFRDGTHLAASIEARRAVGQEYSALKGFFRQYELIYLIAEESDVVRLRTNYRPGEEVYLYHTRTNAADARRLLVAYLGWMNDARARPQWYNALTNNCGTPFARYLAAAGIGGISRWDPRAILDGGADRMLAARGDLADDGLPFPELRRRAWINPAAHAAPAADFSARIRQGRPGFSPP